MKPGQRITRWFQQLSLGRLRTPQAIIAASRAENPDSFEDRFTVDPVDRKVWDVPGRLSGRNFCRSEAYLRQQHRADWQHADYRLKEWAARFVLVMRRLDIPIYVHCCYRNRAQQQSLLDKGHSKVGWPRSAHNIAEAVDIVHGVYQWELTPKEWQFLYLVGSDTLRKFNDKRPRKEHLILNWGGPEPHKEKDTFSWDPAHWEIADYRERIRELPEGVPVFQTPSYIVNR